MKKTLAILLVMLLSLSVIGTAAIAEEPVSIEIYIESPWISAAIPENQPDNRQEWLREHTGYDYFLTYSNSGDGSTVLLTRIASGNAPDIIVADISTIKQLYGEGVLIEDWNPYLDAMPDYSAAMGDLQKTYLTEDDKLIAVGSTPGEQAFTWMIRKDWLKALNLEMPTTLDELYDVLYAFTYNDPDGNGKDDTYGITSAGGGSSVGEFANLLNFFGDIDWYIDENGEANHPILAGYYKDYLDFLKRLYEGGVMDPDWYTQGWEERKAALFSGAFGMTYYPPAALFSESTNARGNYDGNDWWTVLNTVDGYKVEAKPISGVILTVSAQCAESEAKMDAVCKYLDLCYAGSEGFSAMWLGVECDGYDCAYGDGICWIWEVSDEHQTDTDSSYFNWGLPTCSYWVDRFNTSGPEPDENDLVAMNEASICASLPSMDAACKYLTFDKAVLEEVNMVVNEFVMNYIMGNTTDYEGFVQDWLDAGAEDMKTVAEETWKSFGLME